MRKDKSSSNHIKKKKLYSLIFLLLVFTCRIFSQTFDFSIALANCSNNVRVGDKIPICSDIINIETSWKQDIHKLTIIDTSGYQLRVASEYVNEIKLFRNKVLFAFIHFQEDSTVDNYAFVVEVSGSAIVDSISSKLSSVSSWGSFNKRILSDNSIVESIYFWTNNSTEEVVLIFPTITSVDLLKDRSLRDVAVIIIRKKHPTKYSNNVN